MYREMQQSISWSNCLLRNSKGVKCALKKRNNVLLQAAPAAVIAAAGQGHPAPGFQEMYDLLVTGKHPVAAATRGSGNKSRIREEDMTIHKVKCPRIPGAFYR